MGKHSAVALLIVLVAIQPTLGKNRNPDDYPQKAKVLSFSRQRGNGSLTSCDTGNSNSFYKRTILSSS
jgi:hypothetical protein